MFVCPVYITNSKNEPVFYASSLSSLGKRHSVSRASVSSSESSGSSFGLRRSSSIISSKSTSTSASSVESISPKSRLNRTTSTSSFHAHRRLQKKPPKLEVKEPEPIEEIEDQEEAASVASPPTSPTTNAPPRIVTGGSDLLIRCRHDVYHVDRDIMCYFSRWFKTICAVVPRNKESKTVIDLGADDPDAVAAMIQYCYQLDYEDQLAGSMAEVQEVVTLRSHIHVFMLAERYGITGLKSAALAKFELLAAKAFTEPGYEEQLSKAIRIIYATGRTSNADALRMVIIQLCANHVEAFINGTQRTMAIVFESMDEYPEFRTDLFEEMASRSR